MKKIFVLFTTILLIVVFSKSSYAISAPWWIYHSYYTHTIGLSSGVKILDPVNVNGSWNIQIAVKNKDIGSAIATIIETEFLADDGTPWLTISVTDYKGKVLEPWGTSCYVYGITCRAEEYKWAMKGNPYYKGYEYKVLDEESLVFYPLYSAKVVQFFSDDLTEAHGRTTISLEDAFKKILKNNIDNTHIFPGTEKIGGVLGQK